MTLDNAVITISKHNDTELNDILYYRYSVLSLCVEMVLPGRDIGKFKETGFAKGTQLGKYGSYFAAAGVAVGMLVFVVGIA